MMFSSVEITFRQFTYIDPNLPYYHCPYKQKEIARLKLAPGFGQAYATHPCLTTASGTQDHHSAKYDVCHASSGEG
jgi:hypothetical protein